MTRSATVRTKVARSPARATSCERAMSSRIVRLRSSSADLVACTSREWPTSRATASTSGRWALRSRSRTSLTSRAPRRVPRTISGAQMRAWQPRCLRMAASVREAVPCAQGYRPCGGVVTRRPPVGVGKAQAFPTCVLARVVEADVYIEVVVVRGEDLTTRGPGESHQPGGRADGHFVGGVGQDLSRAARASPHPGTRRRGPVSPARRAGAPRGRRWRWAAPRRRSARARRPGPAPRSRPAGSACARRDCGAQECDPRPSSGGRCWRSSRAGARRQRLAARSPCPVPWSSRCGAWSARFVYRRSRR